MWYIICMLGESIRSRFGQHPFQCMRWTTLQHNSYQLYVFRLLTSLQRLSVQLNFKAMYTNTIKQLRSFLFQPLILLLSWTPHMDFLTDLSWEGRITQISVFDLSFMVSYFRLLILLLSWTPYVDFLMALRKQGLVLRIPDLVLRILGLILLYRVWF